MSTDMPTEPNKTYGDTEPIVAVFNTNSITVGDSDAKADSLAPVNVNRYTVDLLDISNAYLLDIGSNTSTDLIFSLYQADTSTNIVREEVTAKGGVSNVFSNFFSNVSGGQSYILLPLVTGPYLLELSNGSASEQRYELRLTKHTGANIGRVLLSVSNADGSYTPSHYPPTNYSLNGTVYAKTNGFPNAQTIPSYHWLRSDSDSKRFQISTEDGLGEFNDGLVVQAILLFYINVNNIPATAVGVNQSTVVAPLGSFITIVSMSNGISSSISTNVQAKYRFID